MRVRDQSGRRLETEFLGGMSNAVGRASDGWLIMSDGRSTLFYRLFALALLGVCLTFVIGSSISHFTFAPPFRDVSREVGVKFVHESNASPEKYIVETMGSGGGFLDYNNDGWLDIYLIPGGSLKIASKQRPINRLYRNNQDGTFTDVTREAGVEGNSYGMGCAFADVDNDGFVDMYITNLGPNVLYHNNGDGTFADVTGRAGVGDGRWSTSAAFADYDRDGYVDLYVCNYLDFSLDSHRPCFERGLPIYCYPHSYEGASNVLYRNVGGTVFEDVTSRAGLAQRSEYSKSLGVIWFDMDLDDDPDLYVTNDTTANYLFENAGDGSFKDISLLSGTAFSDAGMPQAGMGVDAADLGNGYFSLVVTNFSFEPNALYWNEGGKFIERGVDSGLHSLSLVPLGFGVNFFDYDNDGILDLLVANGHVLDNAEHLNPSAEYSQRNQLFRNLGGGKFIELAGKGEGGFGIKAVSRGSATGDFNNDGKTDILINNNNGPSHLLQNCTSTTNHWLNVHVQGTHCNRSGIGTRVTLKAGDHQLRQEVRAGNSYLSQSDLRLHFGLGHRKQIDSLEITWPCGRRQLVVPPRRLDRTVRLIEPNSSSN